MAKIIGEPDCTETIKFNLLKYSILDTYSFDGIRNFKDNYEEFLEKKEGNTQNEFDSFLNNYKQFYYGAIGEEKVIDTLRLLPDTYYVLNEIQIKLTKAVLWKKYFEYVKSAQIDHVVIGDTGIFLIETKNWKEMNLTSVHNSPHKQIERAGMLFWLAQKRRLSKQYKTYNLVVTLKDLPKYNYKYVYQLSIKELNKFILSRKRQLTPWEIKSIKNWLVNLRVINLKQTFWK